MSDSFLDNIERSISSTLNPGETLHNEDADTSNNNDTSQDTGGSNEQQTQQTTNDQGQQTTQQTPPKQDGARGDQQNASQQPGGKPSTQQQPQGQQQQKQPRPHAAQNGDLVDPRTGQVIARAGQERRFYESMTRERNRATQLEQQLQRANQQVEAYKQASTIHTQLGLEPADVTTAMSFMSHFKKAPLEAAQNMLAQLAAAGYDISTLGVGVQVSAIRQMMDERLAPFTQDRAQAQREAEIRASVEREINEVASEFHWFTANESVVNDVLAQMPPNVSLREVALRVENWAIKNGLDLDGDIRAQYLEKINGQQTQPATTQQGQQQQPPINRARGSVPSVNGGGNATGQQVPRQGAPSNANRSNRDIVREAMREAGLSVE